MNQKEKLNRFRINILVLIIMGIIFAYGFINNLVLTVWVGVICLGIGINYTIKSFIDLRRKDKDE